MPSRSLPQPGELLGWVIVFGERHESRCFIDIERGRTAADDWAARHHGIVYEARLPGQALIFAASTSSHPLMGSP